MQQRARELQAVIEAALKEALELRRVQAEFLDKVLTRIGDELRTRVKCAENEKTKLAGGLADAKQRMPHDNERDEEEQLKRNKRKRQ